MDLTQTIIAKSDQLNADDLVGGPQTFTVKDVRMGDSEQPVSIVLAEWPASRPFKPSKTVLRILVHAWGSDSDDWPTNGRMTLYRDPSVKWAGQAVGGIRVSHLSHLKEPLRIALQESKGKKVLYTVEPLPDAPTRPEMITAALSSTLVGRFRQLGYDKDTGLTRCAEVIGHTITDLRELTAAEASQVINALDGEADALAAEDEIDGQTSIGDDAA